VAKGNPNQADIVLVAEDETLVRLIANDILTEAGYRVLEARDGQEALALIELHDDIRVLFTDLQMPNLDGVALAKLVMERWPKIGIVVTSGEAAPEELNAIFVAKPYNTETVRAAIVRALEEAGTGKPLSGLLF
jgi:CheY-like chemotaxis protein